MFAEAGEATMELHVFADSSQKPIGPVAFLRCEWDGEIQLFLIMSKTQVAPLKEMSVPRLKLHACLVARV